MTKEDETNDNEENPDDSQCGLELEALKKEKKRLQARLRAAKYYQKHAGTILEKSKNRYQANKPAPEPEPEAKTNKIKQKTTNEALIAGLEAIPYNSPNTKAKYEGDLKRLLGLATKPLIQHFRDGKGLVELIKGAEYALNTRKSLIQVVLFMITNLRLTINKPSVQALKFYFELIKSQSREEAEKKTEDVQIPTWDEYMHKVRVIYGELSKPWMIATLYQAHTLRDDYALQIVDKSPAKTETGNFLVMLKKNYKIIINSYKTKGKYGQINLNLSQKLTTQLSKYMATNDLEKGDYLFGSVPLSPYVSQMNKTMGYDGSISMFRKMSVTDILNKNPNMSTEERIELAEKMKHSIDVQSIYKRKN